MKCNITIHSRVSGYYTGSVFETWNNGKRKEFTERKHLTLLELLELQGVKYDQENTLNY